MSKLNWLGGLVLVAFTVTSCGSAHTQRVAQSSPKATASPIAQPPTSPVTRQQSGHVTSSKSTSVSPIALVQPTDPSQRTQHVEATIIAGRSDPFAPAASQIVPLASTPLNSPAQPPSPVPQPLLPAPGVPVPLSSPLMPFPPVIVTAPMSIAQPLPMAQLPTLPPAPTAQPYPPTPAAQPYPGSATTLSPASSPVSSPIPTTQPSVPIAPVSLARRIQIMGVIQTKGKATAIVEVPGEGTSRTVSVGERLGNGSVLVKRIQTNGGQEPIVVLEEHGQEVFRAVGSAVISAYPDYY